MSSFSGINTALSALYAQRQALETVGHNIANVNTEGYSRQRVSMASQGGLAVTAIHSQAPLTGRGVRVDQVQRLRDQFLEARGHRESGTLARQQVAQGTLARVELALAEPSETSIGAQLADFWAGWDDLANHPGDVATKAQLVERAVTLTTGINGALRQIDDIRSDALAQASAAVQEVNATAARIAELNEIIQGAAAGGTSANDLLDQRDVLVNKLAGLVGATARPGSDGTIDVVVNGRALVRGNVAETLHLDVAGTPTVRWSNDGYEADLEGGSTAGLLDVVNGALPGYRAGITAVATNLQEWVNAEYRATAPTDPMPATPPPDPGPPAPQFFVRLPDGGIAVHPDVVADPGSITAGYDAGTLDGSRAQRLANLTGPDAVYRETIVRLGVDAQTANRRVEIQSSIVAQVDAARESEAGVNIDEEMASLLSFQHGYNAAARLLTAIDETLDVVINRTGLVGR